MVGPARCFDPFQRLTSVACLGHVGSGKKVPVPQFKLFFEF